MLGKPTSIKNILGGIFDPATMGTGMKRGLVLKVYKAKIKEALGGNERFAGHIERAELKGKDDNPTLFIYLRAGSPWRAELHGQRYQIKALINERLKSDFIKDIRVQ